MEQKDLHKFIEGILNKKRNCIPLTTEEQRWADETYGRLFEKKFGGRTFITQTKDDLRKADGKPADVQPGAAIADERSKPAKKESKINDSDASQNEGAVTDTEEGENVNVDEKRVGGEDDAQTEAQSENASDIINSDKEDLQRKPVLKAGDVVIKHVGGGKLLAGIIVKVYEKDQAAMTKWAGGTFSTDYLVNLEKVADEETEHEVPVSADDSEGTKTPGLDTSKENQGLAVNKADNNFEPGNLTKEPEVKTAKEPGIKPSDARVGDQEWKAPAQAVTETPAEAEEKAPLVEKADAKADADADADDDSDPAKDPDAKDDWMECCSKAVGMNKNAENPQAICEFIRGVMSKSTDKVVKIDIEEVRKCNPKLADQMVKDGHKVLQFDVEKFEKSN